MKPPDPVDVFSVEPDAETRAAMRDMRKLNWELKFSFRTRKCFLSGDKISMFSTAYKGTKILRGPGTDVVIVKWATVESVMFETIKGNQ